MPETCASCRFVISAALPEGATRTLCRRYPPQVVALSVTTLQGAKLVPATVWPDVQPGSWCGEFAAGARFQGEPR